MSDESHAVIATFEDQSVALALQAVLREAGIAAALVGRPSGLEDPDDPAGHVPAPIHLVVPLAQVEEATKALEEIVAPPEEGWEASAEAAIDGWLCRNCDTVVAQDEPACTACGSLRSEQPPQDDE